MKRYGSLLAVLGAVTAMTACGRSVLLDAVDGQAPDQDADVVEATPVGTATGSNVLPTEAGRTEASTESGATICAASETECDGACVDISVDPANCGSCGARCAAPRLCSQSVCTLFCTETGFATCGGICANLWDDQANCGACGNSCRGAQCIGGTCGQLGGGSPREGGVPDAGGVGVDGASPEAGPGFPCVTHCSGACSDPSIDMANCGTCGAACPAGNVCTSGVCQAPTSDWPMFGCDAAHSGFNRAERGVPPATVQWTAPITDGPLDPVTVEAGRAIVNFDHGYSGPNATAPIQAVNIADGSLLWTNDLGAVRGGAHPAIVGGTVYVQTIPSDGSETGTLWALDATDGAVRWQSLFDVQFPKFWAPMVAGTTVYVNGGLYGGLYGWSVSDGSPIFFNGNLGLDDEWSPAFFEGNVYTYLSGAFSALDAQTGKALWVLNVPYSQPPRTDTTLGLYDARTAPVFDATRAYVVAWRVGIAWHRGRASAREFT